MLNCILKLRNPVVDEDQLVILPDGGQCYQFSSEPWH